MTGGSDSNNNGIETIFYDGANVDELHSRHEPRRTGTNNGHPWFGTHRYDSGVTASETEIRHRVTSTGPTAYVNRAMFLELLLDGLVENQDFVMNTSTEILDIADSFVNGASITLPADANETDWIVFGVHHWRVDTAADILQGRILENGSIPHTGYICESEDTSEEWMLHVLTVLNNPANSAAVVNQFQTDNVTGSSDIEWNSIIAIRLDVFEDSAWVRDTTSVPITSTDTDFVGGTLTHTTAHREGQNRRWIFFGNAIVGLTNQEALRHRSRLTQAGGDISTGSARTTLNNGLNDDLPLMCMGITPLDDSVDVDIDFVVQEDVSANVSAIDDTLIVGFTLDLAQPDTAVYRIQDWQASSKTYIFGLPTATPVNTPTTGPSGNVTMGTGPKPLFLFTLSGRESAGLLTVSDFTIGTVDPTGSYIQSFDTGSGFIHTYFWWWDADAILAMTGLAIAWTDDRTWTLGEFQHDWTTFVNVDQSNPVPVTQTSSSASVIELALSNMTNVNNEDMVIILGAADSGSRRFNDFDGANKIFETVTAITGRSALAEGNICGSNILCKFDDVSNDAIVSGIVIKRASAFPYHVFKQQDKSVNTLLTQ